MKLIPYQKITLYPDLDPEQVLSIITNNVETNSKYFTSGPFKLFQGKITGYQFNITRTKYSRDPSTVVIHGIIFKEEDKVIVYLEFRTHPFTYVIFSFFMVVLSYSSIQVFDSANQIVGFYSISFLAFLYLANIIFFNLESKKDKKILLNLLNIENEK